MKKKIKDLCFVGCGNIGYEHALCASKLGANIKYVFAKNKNSKNIIKFKKKFKNSKTLSSLNGLDNLDVDGYIVSIPWHKNDHILKYFYKTKKPVLIEKPIGALSKSYKNLMFKKNKFIAFNRRYYDTVSHLKKRLINKKLVTANILISSKKNNFEKRFVKFKDKINYFSNIHFYDLIFFLFGNLKIILKKKNSRFKNKNSILILKNKKNYLTLNIIDDSYENSEITLRFEDGTIAKLNPLEQMSITSKLNISFKNKQKKYDYSSVNIIERSNYKLGFFNQMKSFLGGRLQTNMVYNERLIKFINKVER